MRVRPFSRVRSTRRTRRARRGVAVLLLTVFACMWTTQSAMAAGAELHSVHLSMPSLSSLTAWLKDPHWGRLPTEKSGTASGKRHHVSARATEAHQGAGHKPGKGKGELAAYRAHRAAVKQGKSAGVARFDARTSKRDAAKSSRTDTVYDNADGSTTRRIYPTPVNYRAAKGKWAPIDVDVRAGPDGRWQEKANSVDVDFAAKADDSSLVSLAPDPQHSVAYGLKDAQAVKGTADGSRVTYRDVLTDTDLQVAPTATGVKEAVVLHSADAAHSWTFPLHLKGLVPVQGKDGSIVLVDAAGRTVERVPSSYAYDSKVDPRSGDPATTHDVTTTLVREGSGYALSVSLDEAWLTDAHRVFPVTVDPTVTDGWTTTYAESGSAGDHSYEQTIKVGSYDSGTHSAAGYVNHWDTAWDASGATVSSATLHLFDTWASTCTAEKFDVALVTKAWTPEGVTSYPGPTYGSSIGSATPTVPNACANKDAVRTVGDWVSVSLSTSAIQGWFSGTTADYGLAVYAATSDALHWKQFGSFNDPSLGPYIVVNYTGNTAPQLYEQFPADNAVVGTTTPELTAWAGGANSTSGSGNQYQFKVYDANNTLVADSGLVSTGDWTVPSGKLAWGKNYTWQVQAYDSATGLYSPADPYELSVQVPQPVITSGLSQNSSDHGFDASIGNYTTSDTDASISTVGPSLDVERDYNSRDPRWTGAFGAGWSSILDSRATEQYSASGAVTSVNVTYPDGSQVGYGKNSDGTFAPGSGRWATFTTVSGGGYSLTDKDDTVYAFTTSLGSGAYGLTSVTDANGRAIALTWTSGHVTRMKSAVSGRSLNFAWSTPAGALAAHVATVTTDLVDPKDSSSALTWTYGYTGDQLSTVCAPLSTTKCTAYGYTTGSQYQNASLDLDPSAAWPLTESSGTTAKDAILANEGTKNATYENVTLGAAGPLTGSSSTAASFNGSTSDVALPKNTGNDTDSGAISLWFKTSAGPGVLYSYASQPIGSGLAAGFYTPSIYVGTDGKLNAEFWYSGGINPIVSSASVADGKWHHVVLSAAGNSQTLFLDNTKVGSRTGTVSIKSAVAFGKNQVFNYLGTGFLGGDWPDEGHSNSSDPTGYATYFTGSIADVAWYGRPLVAADVNALYQYGTHSASLLTSVKRPSGKTFAAMTYDPATTTLTQLTDENGGVWKLAAPTVTGSSQTYRGAVLGAAPAGYYRLGEAAGATMALNEVHGGDGTYSGVTLGATGPFSDAKATTYNGSTSYTELPTSVQFGTSDRSLELWFKTASQGVIVGAQSAAISGATTTSGTWAPLLYVGSDNKLHGHYYSGSGSGSTAFGSTGTVTDNTWHHVALTASGATQTLYLDGVKQASYSGTPADQTYTHLYLGAGFAKSWINSPGDVSHFTGSIADAAFYHTALTAADVAAHVEAAKNSTGLLPVETVKVTSPTTSTLTYTYDVTNGNRALTETDGLGNKTSFGYDTAGFEHTVTDPNGAVTTTGHDVRGNVVSSTNCQDQVANKCNTEYYTYYPDDTTAQLTTADPRNDQLLTERDGRSASATDTTYLTSYTYDSAGNQTVVTGPAVPGFPNGRATTTVYSDGTSTYPSADGGVVPKGLPVKTVSPGGAVNSVSYFANGDVASTTDAIGLVTSYTYDGVGQVLSQKVVSDTYPNGLTTSYTYDKNGQVTRESDPQITDRVQGATHAAVSSTVYDDDGDVLSQTVSDASGGDTSRTETQTYDAYDRLWTQSDANVAAGTSYGNTTTYTYDTSGNKTEEVTSAGNETDYTYDDNGNLLTQALMYTGDPVSPQTATSLVESSRAYDPAGRLASVTDAMGNKTSYTYTDDGLTATVKRTSSDGSSTYTLESDTYDAAGNLLTQTTDNGENVTRYTVDASDRTTSTTVDPTGVDRVSTVSYTPDDQVASENDHDATGYDRTTTDTYDDMGNLLSETLYGDASGHPAGWWKLNQTSGRSVTDASGTGNTATAGPGVTWSDDAAQFSGDTSGNGDIVATNSPVLDTSASYTVSAWVKLSDTSTFRTFVSQGGTNRSSFYLQYASSQGVFRLIAPSSDSSGTPSAYYNAYASAAPALNTWTHLVGVFDQSTGTMNLYVNGALAGSASNPAPWTGSGPLSIGGAETASGTVSNAVNGSVSNVQTYQRALSASEISSLYGKGRSGGTVGSSDQQTTKYTYDKRGLPTSMTDPEQHTTNYDYDEAGNLAATTAPAVQAEADGIAANAQTVRPVTYSGFNTFGEAVAEKDPNGLVTTTAYDADGNKVSETLPSYTPAGASNPNAGTTVWTYDSEGNQTSETTPGGKTTSYLYDQLGDLAQTTAPDGTKTHAVYDANGEERSVTDGTGAQTQATYDFLGRQATATTLERYPSTRTLTTNYSYAVTTGNPYGAHLASVQTPGGVTTSYAYNRAGDVTSVTDGAGNSTSYGYDFEDNNTKTTLADGSYTVTDYNVNDDPTATRSYDSNGTFLYGTSQQYDGNGNLVAATDANQHTTRWTYDAAGTITQQVEPVDATTSITTSFGYDQAGNRTRFTDGRGNSWRYGYTPWGQQEKVIEPTTSQYTSAADSTTTFAYDADGNVTSATAPGGVTTSMTYDDNGQLKTMSGSGAEAASARHSFSYDADGRVTSADTDEAGTTGAVDHQASTHDAFTYDDRGDVLTATGSAGSSSFTYNDDGSMLTRTDAAGTQSYGYDTAGRLSSLDDAASGTHLTYTYDQLNNVKTIKYGSTGQTRTFSYNSAHELSNDVLVQGASTLSSFTYGYDNNGNLTSKTTAGVTGASSNTYSYDWSDRLTSWNNGTATTAYQYDASGNRVRVGSDVYTYDARDQLTSDGTHSYTYSARGTMTQESSTAGGTVGYKTDAFGGQIVAGSQSYTLDALGRNIADTDTVESTTRTFAYSGADNTIATDGDASYTYDPSGGLVGVRQTGASTGALALTDVHDDVVGTFTSGATSLSGSATYDPLGKVTATASLIGHLGFQSGWTEPGTGDVGTASRWYSPATGEFLNKDSVSPSPTPDSVAANPFAYVDDNPLVGTDPSGHCSWWTGSCETQAIKHVAKKVKHVAKAVYHAAKHVARKVVHAVKHAAHKVVHRVRDVYRATVRVVRRVYHYTVRHVRRVYHAAVHAVHTAYHKVSRAVHRVVHAVKKAAHKVAHAVKKAAKAVAHAARTAYHATVKAVKTTAKFVKNHAAAITSIVVSTAVFAGCEAATWGVGTIGCAALAGAAGSLVEQGFKCAQNGGGDCSVGAFAGSAVEGAVTGAVGGALGSLGGKLLAKAAPKAMEVVGGLFGKAAEAGESGAADATDAAAATAESEGAGSRSQSQSEEECHSFTAGTRVLMADGTTKAIDQVHVGDTISNSVPGTARIEAHKVTAVIVTKTDHDFVDLTVKATTEASAKQGAKAGAKSLVKKVARKAAFGLAASAAVLGALAASHGHGTAQEQATKTVAAVSSVSDESTKVAPGTTSDAQGAHLTTTFHHPFYDETQSAFVDAKDLKVGDVLQTPTGTAEVTGVRLYHANTTTYDLTIGSLHTYYVDAGTTPLLVHNCNVHAKQAYDRAKELHEGLRTDAEDGGYAYKNDTTAVVMARDTEGNVRTVVASNRPYVPKAIKGQLDSKAGEVWANGRGHAEVTALNYIEKNNWTFLGGAANRNICAFCENAIRDSGGELVGDTFPGRVKTLGRVFGFMGERMFGRG
ncbi:LamG-like jellyroll fold domain-containing protein [Streptomyces gilvus]|uniref:LamG-like jellyroll fold domain-containing protein n=1 Tax=Streptomyces gilvus TaxID=2920937 RepID=UPI0027E51478|nr:LamG-like jellyroll fold domain-containing protein [Streptomyces sp. CME 23]